MYCYNCGKKVPDNSKFCRFCGKTIQIGTNLYSGDIKNGKVKIINSDVPPYPYVVSLAKLIVLSITTFGVYEIYWFYKHFKSFKAEDVNWNITPWLRALFPGITSYSLFKHVSEKVGEYKNEQRLNTSGLALLFFVLNILWRLPDPYWWLSILTFLPLISVQKAINFYWYEKYDGKIQESRFGTWNFFFAILGGTIVLLAIYGTFFPE